MGAGEQASTVGCRRVQDHLGRSAVMGASVMGHAAVVRALAAAGANLELTDTLDRTALRLFYLPTLRTSILAPLRAEEKQGRPTSLPIGLQHNIMEIACEHSAGKVFPTSLPDPTAFATDQMVKTCLMP